MHRASLYWTIVAVALVAGSKAVIAQTFTNGGGAAVHGITNSAQYNSGVGSRSGGENTAATGQVRDANGNLIIVDGVMSGASSVSRQTGVRQSGVGYAGGNSNAATAIGNSLNVTVIGNWNTVIVDSEQVNNGDQNAEAHLNGDLQL
jgi:holdfast attachment protein HfaA